MIQTKHTILPVDEVCAKHVTHQCFEVLVDVTSATSATCRVMQFLDARFENLVRRDVNSATLYRNTNMDITCATFRYMKNIQSYLQHLLQGSSSLLEKQFYPRHCQLESDLVEDFDNRGSLLLVRAQ